ncbi:MAG TPA: amidohydrolase family protein [Xanthobacteraceae bacterium]|jgi:aminocarboxymuconate-semialdehyde decarboxylase
MSGEAKIIDFHNHHIPARFELTAMRTQPPTQRARWEMLARKLPDEELLLRDVREGHLAARVVNIPGNLIADAEGNVPHETIIAMNDELAGLVARHPGRIHGLASVDGYDGDKSAREAERAIAHLGLRGLFLDCARGDLLIDAQQARPTLEVAAKYGVPVFAHPIAPESLTKQMTPYGLIGTLFARGAVNGASLIALVEGGVFSELPGLHVVVTAHAVGGLAMTAGLSPQSRLPTGTIEVLRKHIFIDSTLVHPAVIRACVDLLGAGNVLAGSDFPIAGEAPIRGPLTQAMQQAKLSNAEQNAIVADNCLRLLGIGQTSAQPNVHEAIGGIP